MFFTRLFRRPIPVAEMVRLYLQHAVGLSKSRTLKCHATAKYWVAAGCPDNVRLVTTDDLIRLRQYMLRIELRPITIEAYISLISTMLRHLGPRSHRVPHGLGLMPEQPYSGRKLAHGCTPKPPAEIEALARLYETAGEIDYCPQRFPGDRQLFWQCWIMIAYNTGLRFSDIVKLSWSHVEFSENRIQIEASKTKKLHLLPINDDLKRHLEMIPRSPSEGILYMPSSRNQIMRRELTRQCQRLGLSQVQPQAIRRAAGEAYESAHPGAGALILGHSLPSPKSASSNITFGHYIRSLETVLRPASEKIPQPCRLD